GLITVIVGAVLMAVLGVLLLKPWRRENDPQQCLFHRYERLLARHGVARIAGEGARNFAARAADALPKQAAFILEFARLYETERYAGQPADAAALKASLNRLRQSLPWRVSERESGAQLDD